MKFKGLFLLILSLFIFSCGDNMLDGIADDDSPSAVETQVQIALNDGDYDYVIRQLANSSTTNHDYSHLSMKMRYQLATAWLGKSGFVAANNLEMFTDSDDEIIAFLVGAENDSNQISKAAVDEKVVYYELIIGMFKNDPANYSDDSMVLVSGFASAMYTIMSAFGAIADISALGTIDINSLTAADIDAANLTGLISNINNVIDLIFNISNVLDDSDTRESVLDFWEDLTGTRGPGGTIPTANDTTLKDALKKGLGLS